MLKKVMKVKLEYTRGILFVRLSGSVDTKLSREINMYLVPKILDQKIKYLVFNLFNVDHIDRCGLDALLNVKCAIKCNKGKICLCEMSDELKSEVSEYKFRKVDNEITAFKEIGVL